MPVSGLCRRLLAAPARCPGFGLLQQNQLLRWPQGESGCALWLDAGGERRVRGVWGFWGFCATGQLIISSSLRA
jgi:hypothetical protein